MYKAIFFDMDGTLLDSDHLVETIYFKLTETYPPDRPLTSISKQDLFAKSYIEVIGLLYSHDNPKYLDFVYDLHSQLKGSYLRLFPHTKEMLKSLKRYPLFIFLVTSELRDIAVEELQMMSIFECFDDIITASDLKNQKPNPEGLLTLMNRYKLNPEDCLFIGDQKTDAQAGREANIMTAMMGFCQSNVLQFGDLFDVVFQNWVECLNHIESKMNHLVIYTSKNELSLMQLTDLHLMDEPSDELTYQNIKRAVKEMKPDLLILTGDQTMSEKSVMLYQKLVQLMDSFQLPWTFIFGNHDTDHGVIYEHLIHTLTSSKYVLFSPGPETLGYSNFTISLKHKDGENIKQLIFMDTHVDQYYTIGDELRWGYGSVSSDQIEWYKHMIEKAKQIKSFVFLHIPIPEYHCNPQDDTIKFEGEYLENPSTPPYDAGFFSVIKQHQHTEIILAGHDHYNDYLIEKEGIKLAYGRVSGHYDYGPKGFPKGFRLITIHQDRSFYTKIYLYEDIKENI